MAMTTTTQGSKVETHIPSFTEHDKLGRLGGKASLLDSESELRRLLIGEFQAAVQAARDASGKVDAGPADAVHAYRKGLRRARAVLDLIGNALPRNERRAVRRALQEARRALGASRDHSVAPETISALPLGDAERATAQTVLDAAAAAMPPVTEIKQLLAEGAARALAQVEALEAALPAAIEWSKVVDGVRRVYDAARSARKGAKRSKRSFHEWRRRSKELTYQLELIATHAGPRASELHRELEGITAVQGPAVDLIMLRDFVRTFGDGIATEAVEHLTWAIEAQLDDLMCDARKAGRELFASRPRRFGRRLTKAVRRDLEPVAPDAEPARD